MRVVLYARYSSDQQQDASIEDQLHVCRARAEREGWTVVSTFADHAISGATNQRPEFRRLTKDLQAGLFDMAMAEAIDRFSRDLEYIAAFYKLCVFHQVRIHTVADGDVSEIHIGLKGMMGSLFLRDLADKTRRGLEGRVRAGRSTGAPAYGFEVVRKLTDAGELDRGLRAIDPVKARTVVARALIDQVIIHPSDTDGDPPRIEVVPELMAMLQTAGVGRSQTDAGSAAPDPVLALFVSSVKPDPGGEP
jgi:site-specific DNA recombinase